MSGALAVPDFGHKPKLGLLDLLQLIHLIVRRKSVVLMLMVCKEMRAAMQHLDAFVVARPLTVFSNGRRLNCTFNRMNALCRVTCLILDNCDLRVRGMRVISQILRLSPNLFFLDLSHNHIGNIGATWLSFELSRNDTLIWLSVRGNNIKGLGARAICYALCTNTNLEFLDFSHNLIFGPVGLRCMKQLLRDNMSLKTLTLSDCGLATSAGVQLGKTLIQNVTLEILHLGGNSLGDKGLALLTRGLVHNKSLRVLDLTRTGLRARKVTRALVYLLEHNRTLNEITFTRSDFTTSNYNAVVAAQLLHNTCICIFV